MIPPGSIFKKVAFFFHLMDFRYIHLMKSADVSIPCSISIEFPQHEFHDQTPFLALHLAEKHPFVKFLDAEDGVLTGRLAVCPFTGDYVGYPFGNVHPLSKK